MLWPFKKRSGPLNSDLIYIKIKPQERLELFDRDPEAALQEAPYCYFIEGSEGGQQN